MLAGAAVECRPLGLRSITMIYTRRHRLCEKSVRIDQDLVLMPQPRGAYYELAFCGLQEVVLVALDLVKRNGTVAERAAFCEET